MVTLKGRANRSRLGPNYRPVTRTTPWLCVGSSKDKASACGSGLLAWYFIEAVDLKLVSLSLFILISTMIWISIFWFGVVLGLIIPELHPQVAQQPLQLVPGQGDKDPEQIAPLFKGKEDILPNKYIVVFKPHIQLMEIDFHRNWLQDFAGAPSIEFFNINDRLQGYFGTFSPGEVAQIQQNSVIRFVETDKFSNFAEFDIQANSTWSLSRISHRELINDQYLFDDQGGKGVISYVIDSGIKVSRPEFEGRARWGKVVGFPYMEYDQPGHGTHVAGIIGSKTYGVVKHVDLVAVSVMGYVIEVSVSAVIKGFQYVVEDFNEKLKEHIPGYKGSTVNLSIRFPATTALDLVVEEAVNAGLHVVVCAGNDNKDACDYSPARANGPITAGAIDINNFKANFSNWGPGVDLFAPGVDVLSTFNSPFETTKLMSGTSMATPHITGILSYFLSLQPNAESEFSLIIKPRTLKHRLIKYATKGVIQGLNENTTNALVYNGGGNTTEFWDLTV